MNKRAEIILAGGGHSHVLALVPLIRRVKRAARVTLISPQTHTPYSGMLPGCVAGHYRREACFINLEELARRAGARFIRDEMSALAADVGVVETAAGARLRFDLLSANTGSVPDLPAAKDKEEDEENVAAVKPMGKFLDWLFAWTDSPRAMEVKNIALIGAGAAGVEIALALDYRLRARRCRARLTLIDAAGDVAPSFPAAARRRLRRALQTRDVNLMLDARAAKIGGNKIRLEDGREIAADKTIVAVGAAPPPWAKNSGLALDKNGFVRVNKFLQSVSDRRVFVCGDAAAHPAPLPKAGVFAVRQGAPLAANLHSALRGEPFCEWRDTPRALAIFSAGAKSAIAAYGDFVVAGKWVWRGKHFLDSRFMRRFA